MIRQSEELDGELQPKRRRTGSASTSAPKGTKRGAEEPPDDPRGGAFRAVDEEEELSLEIDRAHHGESGEASSHPTDEAG